MMATQRSGLLISGFTALIWILLTADVSNAAQPEDCPLFFPDFRCERSGRYEGFVMPMASPYLFEDPFITTGVQGVGIWHDFPGDSVFGGGDAWVVALQARVAITDRLALIATKDGYIFMDPANDAVFKDNDGFFDITAGLKYALIDMPEKNFIASPSLRFDIPVGDRDVFSGNGDGVVIPAMSAAWGIDKFHVIGDLGGRIPFDRDKESTSLFYHLHLDYALLEYFVPLIELSGYHWTNSGDGSATVHGTKISPALSLSEAQAALGVGRFEGADLVNLGSEGVAGNDLVTLAFGAKIPLNRHVAFGVIYELPITHREDIFNQRVMMSVVLEF
jgi:hypothetical protein